MIQQMDVPRSVESCLQQLAQASDPNQLLTAVQAVAATRHPAAVEPLIQALTYNNPAIFEIAVQGLASIGEPAVQPLIDRLEHFDYGSRFQGLRALLMIGDARARTAYEYWLKADITPSVRRICIKGLGQFQDTESRHFVARALSDQEWSVRYCAIGTLASWGLTAETRSVLKPLCSDPERVIRLKAAQVLAST